MHVTGVIACHNYEDFVKGAIESFSRQEHSDKSLVVIDDGSCDGSHEAILTATAKLPYQVELIYIDEPVGPAAAKNLAIRTAWNYTHAFAFLDADDEYRPTKLTKSVQMLGLEFGRVGIVYSDEHVIESGGSYYGVRPSFSLESLIGGGFAPSNFVAARAVFEKAGMFDEQMTVAEGQDLAIRAIESHAILHIPEDLVVTRLTPRSLRNRIPPEEWSRNHQIAVTKAQNRNVK